MLYLWIRIRIHGPKWMQIRPDPDPDPAQHKWNSIAWKKLPIYIIYFFYPPASDKVKAIKLQNFVFYDNLTQCNKSLSLNSCIFVGV